MTGVITVALLSWVSCVAPVRGRLVDLSYTYMQDAPTSPGLRPFELIPVKKGLNKYGIW